MDGKLKQICLQLHERLVAGGTAVGIESGRICAAGFVHGVEDVRYLKGDGLDGGELGVGKSARLTCRPRGKVNSATGEPQRRENVVGYALLAQIL